MITPSEARAALKSMANREWPNYESAKLMLEAFIEQVDGVPTVGGAEVEVAAETRPADALPAGFRWHHNHLFYNDQSVGWWFSCGKRDDGEIWRYNRGGDSDLFKSKQDAMDALVAHAVSWLSPRDPLKITQVPEGHVPAWKLVPWMMTEEMQKHFKLSISMGGSFLDAWGSALQVSPIPATQQDQSLSDLQRLGQEFDAAPVTEQAQPVAVTTHGQLDLIRRDDSGKMFPLDGYLHRSVEAIPLFTSPPDQSTQHFKTLLEQESARYAQACDDIEQWTKKFDAQAALLAAAARVIHSLGEMTGALETVLGLAYSKDGVKLGPDKGLEIKIARARSVLAKLHEVRG